MSSRARKVSSWYGVSNRLVDLALKNTKMSLVVAGQEFMMLIKGSLGGETSVLRTFRMSGKELVKERVSKERVRQGKS